VERLALVAEEAILILDSSAQAGLDPAAPPTGRNALAAFGPRLTEFLGGNEFALQSVVFAAVEWDVPRR
jgi:hypothetical protein